MVLSSYNEQVRPWCSRHGKLRRDASGNTTMDHRYTDWDYGTDLLCSILTVGMVGMVGDKMRWYGWLGIAVSLGCLGIYAAIVVSALIK